MQAAPTVRRGAEDTGKVQSHAESCHVPAASPAAPQSASLTEGRGWRGAAANEPHPLPAGSAGGHWPQPHLAHEQKQIINARSSVCSAPSLQYRISKAQP